eukprot:4316563-Prymnesium_polylepis.1
MRAAATPAAAATQTWRRSRCTTLANAATPMHRTPRGPGGDFACRTPIERQWSYNTVLPTPRMSAI